MGTELLSELLLSSFSIFSLHLQTDASLFFLSAPMRNKSRREKKEAKNGQKGIHYGCLHSSSSSLLLHLKTLLLVLFF